MNPTIAISMTRCKCCNVNMLNEEIFVRMKSACHVIDIPTDYTLHCVLKQHEAFSAKIKGLTDHRSLIFFKHHNETKKIFMERPVLLHSISNWYVHETSVDICHRTMISLVELKLNHVHRGYQMLLWIVTRPELTMMSDGTIYLLVHDVHYFTVRLVIRNWSYLVPTNEPKSAATLNRILDDLLPLESLIILFDPLLSTCLIDGQLALCCDAPNLQLILIERTKKCFVDEPLNELRRRGNEAYKNGDIQIALDYYSFSLHRLAITATSLLNKKNDDELNLFVKAFQGDIRRLYANRSTCYLRENIYGSALADTFVVSTAVLFDDDYDEYFLKCIYRLICGQFGLDEYGLPIEMMFKLSERVLKNYHFQQLFADDFHRLHNVIKRLKSEQEQGMFDLRTMLSEDPFSQKTFFDLNLHHANFKNNLFIKKRRGTYHAKCDIPSGSLLMVERAFAFVRTGIDQEKRLLNEVERRLNITLSSCEFESIEEIPAIHQWLEDETDAEPNEPKSYPETMPWRVLIKAQDQSMFQSKDLIGWWPGASHFQWKTESKENENLFWIIAGKSLFIFNSIPVKKNEPLIISATQSLASFNNHREIPLSIGKNRKISLKDILEDLKRTQKFVDG